MPYKPKILALNPELTAFTQAVLSRHGLTTVCEAASCPNRSVCYAKQSATFMILGKTCSRNCHFCDVDFGKGLAPDLSEPNRLAEAIFDLKLSYVVITSVDRDDLPDYGSEHFKACVEAVTARNPKIKIELLTPDFRADPKALSVITDLNVHKLAHNQETVRRLSKVVRPQSDFDRSLRCLQRYAQSGHRVKSSLMVGLGEKRRELLETMQELLDAGVVELTLGQYLQPSPQHHPVAQYFEPQYFESLKAEALAMGFEAVASGPLVRSSFFAEDLGLS